MADLGERIRTHHATKWAMYLTLAVGIPVPYFTLQRWQPFSPVEPFVTPIDAWVPFEPAWTPVYLSVCLLVPLFPRLAREREAVWRYALGVAWLCLPCYAFFLLAGLGVGLGINSANATAMQATPASGAGATSTALGIADALSVSLAAGVGGALVGFGERMDWPL